MAVHILVKRELEDGYFYIEAAGLTDEKPSFTGMASGSKFIDAETGDEYIYEEETPTWIKIGGTTQAETTQAET